MSTILIYNESPIYIHSVVARLYASYTVTKLISAYNYAALHYERWDSIITDSQTDNGDTDIVNQTNPFIPDLSYRSETSWLPIPSNYVQKNKRKGHPNKLCVHTGCIFL